MNDETAIEKQSQNSLPKTKSNKKILFLLIGLLLVFILAVTYILGKQQELPQPVPQPTPTLTTPRVEDQIIIKFKPGLPKTTIIKTLEKYNASIIKSIDAINRFVIQVPKGQEDAILKEMKKDNLIEEAEPDYINEATFVPNDPSLNVQWGLENTGQTINGQAGTPDADINAGAAWDVTQGNGVKIAILDTGINLNHPEFLQKILTTKDFIGTGIEDQYGHGTHVAGIAAARTNNSVGISGTCPDCILIIGKVLNDQGSGPDSILIQGIIWAADEGAKVINMSFGGTGNSTAKQDAIDYAWNKGAVLVASAGNGVCLNPPSCTQHNYTQKNYPGANDNVISVSATDNNDQKASFSTYSTWVDVAAPGKAIYSTLPTHAYNMQTKTPSLQLNYDYLNGTSMATPMVSGVVGLIWTSSYGTSNTAVVQRLYDTADKISGTGTYWIYGRVNAGLAVSGGVSATPTPTNAPTPTTAQPTPTPTLTNAPTPTTAQPTPTPTLTNAPTPTTGYVTPTIYCLGSCPTLPITPTTTRTPSNQPSPSQLPSPVPSQGITPTTQVTPSVTPSPTPQPGKRGNIIIIIIIWIRGLIDLIIQFLLYLLRLLGFI